MPSLGASPERRTTTASNIAVPGAAGCVAVNPLDRLASDPTLGGRYEKIILVDPLQYGVQKIPETILADPRYEFVRGSIKDRAREQQTRRPRPRRTAPGTIVADLIVTILGFVTAHYATELDPSSRPLSARSPATSPGPGDVVVDIGPGNDALLGDLSPPAG